MTLPGRLLPGSLRLVSVTGLAVWLACGFAATAASAADSGVAVLLVDTDRVAGTIDERIYGHFLEEINHSVVDGLYAEQVRGQGFEGKDFADYWTPFGKSGEATLVATKFERGEHSVRLAARAGTAGIRQGRLYVEAGQTYDGSLWLDPERGTLAVSLRIVSATGRELAKRPLEDQPCGLAGGRLRVHERGHRSAGVARARRDGNGFRARGFHLAHARRRT